VTPRLTDVTTRRPLTPSRRAWAAWIAVGAMLVLVAAGVALHSPWLSVREIEIAGAEHVDAADRLAAAEFGTGAIMIWFDTGAAEAVIASHPWAAAVRVHREWPDRVVVEVEERIPGLWVEGTDGWMLVATDGMVLETAATPGSGLLTVSIGVRGVPAGVTPDDPLWGEIVGLSGVLSTPLASASRLVGEGAEVWLETPDHRVRLGHPIDLADKGRVVQVMLADGLPPGSTLDVVAPRRPAVIPPPSEIPEATVEASAGIDP